MELPTAVALANLAVIAGYPVIGAVIGRLHKANADRWAAVRADMAKARRDHKRLRRRLRAVEARQDRLANIYGPPEKAEGFNAR